MRRLWIPLALGLAVACNDGGDKDDGSDGTGSDGTDTEDGADTDDDGADTDDDGTDTDDDGTDTDDDGTDTDGTDTDVDTDASDTGTRDDTGTPAVGPDPSSACVRVLGVGLDGGYDATISGVTVDPSWAGMGPGLSEGPFDGYVEVPSGQSLTFVQSAFVFDPMLGPIMVANDTGFGPLSPGDHVTILSRGTYQFWSGPFGPQESWAFDATPLVESPVNDPSETAYTVTLSPEKSGVVYDWVANGFPTGLTTTQVPTQVLASGQHTSFGLEESSPVADQVDALIYDAQGVDGERYFGVIEGDDSLSVHDSEGNDETWYPEGSARFVNAIPGSTSVDIHDLADDSVLASAGFLETATSLLPGNGFAITSPIGSYPALGALGLPGGAADLYYITEEPATVYVPQAMTFDTAGLASGSVRYHLINLYPGTVQVSLYEDGTGTTLCNRTLTRGRSPRRRAATSRAPACR